jgi:hypothetical protein
MSSNVRKESETLEKSKLSLTYWIEQDNPSSYKKAKWLFTFNSHENLIGIWKETFRT